VPTAGPVQSNLGYPANTVLPQCGLWYLMN
jgi:hypothetical protein